MRLRAELVPAALAAGLSTVVSLLVLRPWRAGLDVPYSYLGDANLNHMFIKDVLEHGWYWRNSELGAPAGQQLFDYPVLNGDPLNVLLVNLFGLFTSDAAAVMNLLFLVTFPLVAVSACLVLRTLGLSRPAAVVFSSLYALLPYHFVRGETHIWLSAYYAVPLGAYLVLAILGDRPLIAKRPRPGGGRVRSYASGLTLTTLALCLVISWASGSFYYSAFTVVLVVVAALLRSLVRRSAAPLLQAGAVVSAIVAFSVLALAPSLAYWARHGTNGQVAHRQPREAELYGLKPAQLVLPMGQHRVGLLARKRQSYDRWSDPTEATTNTALGAVGAAGLLWLLAVCFLQLAGPGSRSIGPLHVSAGLASLVALILAWTGGPATLIGFVEPQIRAWNRLSIFIGFFALLAVGLLVDRLRSRRVLWGAVLVAVLVLGSLDQTSPAFALQRSAADEWRSDDAFVRGIEQRLPAGAMVYELPYVGFPETPSPGGMYAYDSVRGYLHSHDLRWSFGAMRGRPPDDRFAPLAAAPVSELLPIVSAVGFRGVWVDRLGYADHGVQVESELARLAGPAELVSGNERFAFYDLLGYKAS